MLYMNFLIELKTHNIPIKSKFPLLTYNAFQINSQAEFFCSPNNIQQLQIILQIANTYNIPITILGEGSNVLVPNSEIKGLIICTSNIKSISVNETSVNVEGGCSVRHLCTYLANKGKQSVEFLYGMPGTIGGACWMNARCYGREISEVLIAVKGLNFKGELWNYTANSKDFSYKISPFQKQNIIITNCILAIKKVAQEKLWQEMLSYEYDRRIKGHYTAPCAGSVFKNNHNFGMPSGKLLDTLGFRGKVYGGAMVNPLHANIIINANNATAKEIYELSLDMQRKVYETYGFALEHEIQLLGESSQWHMS